jgi:molybdopterin-guanine dinucleotide biosynthesis protein A
MDESTAGLVLAAGKSRRMGTDKALVTTEGIPLWQRQRDLLTAAGVTQLFLSARPEQNWTRHAAGFSAVLHDAFPECGPLAGICAGLERTTCSHVMVLAIDLPRLPAAWFARLKTQCDPDSGCAGQMGGQFEPLAAIYPRELKWLSMEHLARGDYSLQSLIKSAIEQGLMRVVRIKPAEAPWFENWNEPRDIE